MSSLYHAELLEHYKASPYRKTIATPTLKHGELNPSCGDKLEIMLLIENSHITDLAFQGSGCVISQAAMSMICENIAGKTVEAILSLNPDWVLELINIELGPVRMKCAMLGLQVIQHGLEAWKQAG